MARSGMEIMLATVIKALGLDPVVITKMVAGVQETVLNADARIAQIERNQRLIMAHLGIVENDGRNNHHAVGGTINGHAVVIEGNREGRG
jgi:hypothetical protein